MSFSGAMLTVSFREGVSLVDCFFKNQIQSRCLVRFAERFQLSEHLLAQLMAAVLRQLSKARAEMERGREIFWEKVLYVLLCFLNLLLDFGFYRSILKPTINNCENDQRKKFDAITDLALLIFY